MMSRKRRTFPGCLEADRTPQCNCLGYFMRMKSSCSRPERWPDRPLKSVMTGRMISLSARWSARTNYKSGSSQNIWWICRLFRKSEPRDVGRVITIVEKKAMLRDQSMNTAVIDVGGNSVTRRRRAMLWQDDG